MADENSSGQEVKIEYVGGGDLPMTFVDFFIAQNSPDRGIFYLTVLQSRPPFGSEPEDVFRAQCVAKFALTPATMFSLINLLQRNFERYHAMVQRELGRQQATQDDESKS
ncbi:MAG TPA: hypothetical protein VEB21_12870 [Terriglobales bacterium]|nr:hypothetical protein [Terriglobales bacterium]